MGKNNILKVDEEIFLKKLEEADAEIYFDLITKNRDYLKNAIFFDAFLRDLRSQIFYINSLHRYGFINNFLINYNGIFVGSMELHSYDKINNEIELGYWIDEDFQNKKIITRCCNKMIDYTFKIGRAHV